MAADWSHVHFPRLRVRVSDWFCCESISGHHMQRLRSFCHVHNTFKVLRFFFFSLNHPSLLGKEKQAFEERCCLTGWRSWQMTCFSSNLSQLIILFISTFWAGRFVSPRMEFWSPENRQSPHMSVFYLAKWSERRKGSWIHSRFTLFH